MIRPFAQLLRFAAWVSLIFSSAVQAAPVPDIRIQDQDGTLLIDITYRLPVSQRIAWDVLTDFDAMADFVPDMEQSRILQRTDKRLLVEQKGQVRFGVLRFSYDSKREIELMPYQTLRSRALSGTKMNSTTTLTPAGNGTLLAYHAEAVPDLPVSSSVIISSLNDMLETQFKAMEQEMETRAKADKPEPATPTMTASAIKPLPVTQMPAAKNSQPVVRTKTPINKPAVKAINVIKKRPG